MNQTHPSRGRTLLWWGLNALWLAGGLWLTTGWKPERAEYPARPINLIVPFGTGGGSDAYARLFKTAIDENHLLPVPLVIHNRGGAGATIGSRYVRDASPDGYTVLLLHEAIITAKYSGMVRYGPEAFDPVACTGQLGMVIAVADDSPYHSLNELVAAAREHPGELSFAVNRGALTHVAGLQLEGAAPGAKFRFPQSGGGAERYKDLIGGHVDVSGFSIEEFLRFRAGGAGESQKLRGLAYLDDRRNPAAPEVPTAREQGYDIININRFYWWVPQGTPPDRIATLANVLREALDTEFLKQRMAEAYYEPVFLTGRELARQLQKTENQVAQVEFSKPQGVPNMERLMMIAVALLLGAWVIQTGRKTLQIAAAALLAACLVLGHYDERIEGWGLFAGLAGSVFILPNCLPLLQDRRTALCIGWTLGYALSLTFGWGDFRWLTILYVLLIGGTLTDWSWPRLPVLGLIAQTLGFGLYAVFTLLFEVPLPP